MTKSALTPSLQRARKAEMVARYRAMKHNVAATNSHCGSDEVRDDKNGSARKTYSDIETKANRGVDWNEIENSPSLEGPHSLLQGKQYNTNDEQCATAISSSSSSSRLSSDQMKAIAKRSTAIETSTSSSSSSQEANRGTAKSRAAAIADAKKKLTAARMISYSRSMGENERTILPAVSSIKSEESETELIEKLHKSTLGVRVTTQSTYNTTVENNDLSEKSSLHACHAAPSNETKPSSPPNSQPQSHLKPKTQIGTNESIPTSTVTPFTTRAKRLSRLRSRSPSCVSSRTGRSNELQHSTQEFSTKNTTSRTARVPPDNNDCHSNDPEPVIASSSRESDEFDFEGGRTDNSDGKIEERRLNETIKAECVHATFNRKTSHAPYAPPSLLSASTMNTSNQHALTRLEALKTQRGHYFRMKAAPKKPPGCHGTASQGRRDNGRSSSGSELSHESVRKGVEIDTTGPTVHDPSLSSMQSARAEKQDEVGYDFFGRLSSSNGDVLSDGILTQIYDGRIDYLSHSSQLVRRPPQAQPPLHSDSFLSTTENSSFAAFHALGHPSESDADTIVAEMTPSISNACPDPPLENYSTASTSTDSLPLIMTGIGDDHVRLNVMTIEEDAEEQAQNNVSVEIEKDTALIVLSACTKEESENIDREMQTCKQGNLTATNDEWSSEDAFSPTSWGSRSGFSSGEKWDENTSTDPFQNVSPRNKDDMQWNRCANKAAVRWDDESEERNEDEMPALSCRNGDYLHQQSPGITCPWDDTDDEREEWSRHSRSSQIEARDEMEVHAGNLAECEHYKTDELSHYEGFGNLVDSNDFNCKEFRDFPSAYADRDEFNMEINVNMSRETAGSATEFDPISIFEGCESVSPEMNDNFPEDEVEEDCIEDNDNEAKNTDKNNGSSNSAISWTSPKLLIPDDSKSTALGMKLTPLSIKGGNEVAGAVESPSGTESLESWWQSRYASTQNNDINAAVHQALTKQVELPYQNHSRFSRSRPIPNMGMNLQRSKSRSVRRDPIQSRARSSNRNRSKCLPASPNSEDGSIFSGLDDDSSKNFKAPTSKHDIMANRRENLHSRNTKILSESIHDDETDDEDIFSGVESIRSRHGIDKKDKNPEIMKSLMDSMSTNEGQSSRDRHATQERCFTANSRLFLHERSFGIIDIQNMDGQSPTGASITSDITTSVIFGGDFSKKAALRFSAMERNYGPISEATGECVTKEETPSNAESPIEQSIPQNTVIFQLNGSVDNAENEQLNDVDPHIEVVEEGVQRRKEFSKEAIRGRSLMSPSTTDSVTNPSQSSSLLKKAFLLAKYRTSNDDSDTAIEHAKCNPIRSKSSIFSHFSCGVLSASSFTICAMKAGNDGVNEADSGTDPPKARCDEVRAVDSGVGAVNSGTCEKKGFVRGRSDMSANRSLSETLSGTVETDVGTQNKTKAGQSISESLSGTIETGIETLNRTRASYSISETLSATIESEARTMDQSRTEDEYSGFGDDEDKSTSSGEATYDEHDDPTVSTYEGSRTQATSESSNEDNSKFVLSTHEKTRLNEWKDEDSYVQAPNQVKTIVPPRELQSQAYEKLLLYAYTSFSMPPPSNIIEKGGSKEVNDVAIQLPSQEPEKEDGIRTDEMNTFLEKLNGSGMEVLKLNREKKWQQRFLTITKEVTWFKKNENDGSIDSFPKGLLWAKNIHSKERSVDDIGKNGKGGTLFADIESVSVTKDNFTLNRKQKRGKFKNSYTFVLRSNVNGSNRDILFRCMTKDDVCILLAGFHEILHRIKNDEVLKQNQIREPLRPLSTNANDRIETPLKSPTASAKPFSPKAAGGPVLDDRWEV